MRVATTSRKSASAAALFDASCALAGDDATADAAAHVLELGGAAGLNAVFVPHDQTWILEHEEVGVAGARGRLLTVERFSDLRAHF